MVSTLLKYLNRWVVLGGLAVLLLLVIFWGGALWFFYPGQRSENGVRSGVLTVIPAPTLTSPVPAVEAPTPVIEETEMVVAGGVEIGVDVKVDGTGGAGLRIRSDPGIASGVQFLATDGDVFQVDDGPEEADGYTWWFVVSSRDPTRRGWAVSNYLVRVVSP